MQSMDPEIIPSNIDVSNTGSHNRQWLKILLILIVLTFVFLAIKFIKFNGVGSNRQTDIKTELVDISKLPVAFPPDMPLETNAKVLQNYNATAKDGTFQATREFVTSKTLAEDYKIYNDYFAKKGWAVVSRLDKENLKAIFAQVANQFTTVTIQKNNSTGIKTVSISLTVSPTPQAKVVK